MIQSESVVRILSTVGNITVLGMLCRNIITTSSTLGRDHSKFRKSSRVNNVLGILSRCFYNVQEFSIPLQLKKYLMC